MYRQRLSLLVNIQHAFALSDACTPREAVAQMPDASDVLSALERPVYDQVAVVCQGWQLRRAVLHVRRCWHAVTSSPEVRAFFAVVLENSLYNSLHYCTMYREIVPSFCEIIFKLCCKVVLSFFVDHLRPLCIDWSRCYSVSQERPENHRVRNFEGRFLHAVYQIAIIIQGMIVN